MSSKLSIDEIKMLPDQELFNLLGTEINDTIEQELKDRGYSESELHEKEQNAIKESAVSHEESEPHDNIESEQKKDEKIETGEKNTIEQPGQVTNTETDIQSEAKKKMPKKTLIITGAVLVAIVVAAIVLLRGSEFKKVEREALQIAGTIRSGSNYFTIDTYPDEYENMDELVATVLKSSAQENAIEAIKYANEALGFTGALYSDMMKTTAIMGRQTEENNKYKVSWTYHPDDGLEVTYEKK